MLMILFWVIVGVFVGWSFPQPAWVKSLQAAVVTKVKSWFGK